MNQWRRRGWVASDAALAAKRWQVTQSAVSRDIAALRLVKVGGAYQRPPSRAAHSSDPDRRRVAEDVFGVEPSGDTITVLHTPPGEARTRPLSGAWKLIATT